jgi:pheromone a factor receptor
MAIAHYYPNEVYTTFAFFGLMFSVIPFAWHLQAWNTGTCLFMFWAGLGCLNAFVNSIVWHHSVINYAPVWCDISSRIIIAISVAIPASMLCINRRLYHIASIKTVTISRAEKRRGVMIDLAIGLGIPIIEMVLAYIPQGHRFNILEDVGCYPAIYMTPVGWCLVAIWPALICFVSAIYSILAIRAFYKSQAQFEQILSHHKNCNKNRYLRLMVLAAFEVVVNFPLAIQNAVSAWKEGMFPWLGWADTHYNFSRVVQTPRVLWMASVAGVDIEKTRWLIILCPYVFFFFFGFAEEARKNYRSAIQTISKHTGISTIGSWGQSRTFGTSKGSTTQVDASNGSLPVFVKRDIHRKRDTLDSISDMTTSIDGSSIIDEKIYDEKNGIPDYENIVLPVAGGVLDDIKVDDRSPTPSSGPSSNSSTASLPNLAVPQVHAPRPDSAIIEISSIRDEIRVSDKESRV